MRPREFTLGLARGLLTNEARYGYQSCPCRLARAETPSRTRKLFRAITRDPDLAEYGACYCALYVTQEVIDGTARLRKVPTSGEGKQSVHPARRPRQPSGRAGPGRLPYPVWRHRVCGYLCARDGPPEVCPVCKARKDRFERFW